jgi:glutathione peroxidase
MKAVLIILIPLTLFVSYVIVDNRKNKHMSFRQKMIRSIYPLIMKGGKVSATVLKNDSNATPNRSIFEVPLQQINGSNFDWSQVQGKKLLIVNTASDCGFTPQYESLQKLQDKYLDKLVVLGFPCNEFKGQEKGSNEKISNFCKLNYGIQFPLMVKGNVKRTAQQQPIYQWLTDPTQNGWNSQAPSWNFCKYLINESGVLTHYFDSKVDPMSPEIEASILSIENKP